MNAEPETRKKKNRLRIVRFLLIPLIFFGGLLFMCYKALIPVDVRRFDSARIQALETEYNMDLSTVTPQRYWQVGVAQDTKDMFRFTVNDPADFMKNCFFGEIVSESADEITAEYICVPYPDEQGDSLKRFCFLIHFERSGAIFEARLTSYYQIVSNRRESARFSDPVFPDAETTAPAAQRSGCF